MNTPTLWLINGHRVTESAGLALQNLRRMEHPAVFETGAGFWRDQYADGTVIECHYHWPATDHPGYKGFPTHPPPHGWRRDMAEEIRQFLDWSRSDRNNCYPDDPLY